jgi:hypothetical protein
MPSVDFCSDAGRLRLYSFRYRRGGNWIEIVGPGSGFAAVLGAGMADLWYSSDEDGQVNPYRYDDLI